VIDGKNFDPDAATSVIFTSKEKETLTVPALSVTPTAVAVSVPPFNYSKDTGKFNTDVVSYKVVQVKKDGKNLVVRTSNEISGIQVLAPAVPKVFQGDNAKKVPVGTMTRAFTAIASRSLADAAKHLPASSTKAVASLQAAKSAVDDLLVSLDKFIKNPNVPLKLNTSVGGLAFANADEVAYLDAFYSGYLGLAEQRQILADKKDPSSLIAAAHAEGTDCQIDSESGEDPAYILTGELGCFLDKFSGVSDEAINQVFDKSNYNSKFILILPTIALGIASGGFTIEAQLAIGIAYSLAADVAFSDEFSAADSLPGILSAIGDVFVELPQKLPKGFPLISVLTLTLEGIYESCTSEGPSICSKSQALISEYGNNFIYLVNNAPDVIGYLFDNPGDFYDLITDSGVDNGGYVVVNAVVETTPVEPSPAPINPAPNPSPNPSPNPGPNPKPSPPPSPNPVDCERIKQQNYVKCLDSCGSDNGSTKEYGQCLTGCDMMTDLLAKSDCINRCIGAWQKANAARSKCATICINTYNGLHCP
jgi:hypothetical protein